MDQKDFVVLPLAYSHFPTALVCFRLSVRQVLGQDVLRQKTRRDLELEALRLKRTQARLDCTRLAEQLQSQREQTCRE